MWRQMTTASAVLQSITVKASAAGNMIVTVARQVNYSHTQGNQGAWCMGLSQKSGDAGACTPMAGSSAGARNYVAASVPSTVSGYGALDGYSIVQFYTLILGGLYTFYLNGYMSGFSSAYLFQPSMTAQFVSGTLASK